MNLGSLVITFGADTKPLEQGEARAKGVVRSLLGEVSQSTTLVDSAFRKLYATIGAVVAGYEAKKLAASMLEVASTYEKVEVRLKHLLGSQQKAGAAMEYLQEQTSKLPYTLEELVEAGTKLQVFGADMEKWLQQRRTLLRY